jgi:NADH dehydrogenase [ubiquinone] 1 alpha subcomplex assembly factor 2
MQPVQMLQSRHEGSGIRQSNIDQEYLGRPVPPPQVQEKLEDAREDEDDGGVPKLKKKKVMRKEPKDSPWKKAARGNPGDEWQPQEWAPAPAKRRA